MAVSSHEDAVRAELVRLAASLFQRGYSVGSAGNISAKVEDGILMTPTNSCLGFLDAARIAKLDPAGNHLSGDKPSKEVFLHQAFYETRPEAGAVVHLHSTHATALSCLADLDPEDTIPPITPYVVMRVGRVPLLPYVRPGDPAMGDLVRARGGRNAAVLLANHGPVVSGPDLLSAVYAAEELEETAKLLVLLRGQTVRHLTGEQVADLARVFKLKS
ncbi:3-oxo-tetronate 4-phosphate decarboxylase [Enterovirga rhinocerotis]|uniref:3-oxo-tetronate 4-phosphate decarboxylase n=1 Tax=Enterovirga rhinocerotis TaxID=1339210 RepID=A0A4R7BYP3_9HYPH|nr:3-oxo-tetronate 4-phosphate decarboxylase [Enterovirga rhinocerotis]TDR89156.1 ribulose-5-phosphate 4-epimerase/fuculose-1-phosphate aldolase [Enterovirga rhinocerotis]